MDKLPITFCLVVSNEEKKILKCLNSIKDVADQVIIIHDGECLDNTLKISMEFTKDIFVVNKVGEAEPHRVLSFSKARNEWIFQIDADEYLTEDLKNNLKATISSNCDIAEFGWPIFSGGKYHYGLYKRALFKKSKVCFVGIPHESVEKTDKLGVISRFSYTLGHDQGFISFAENMRKKIVVSNWPEIHARYLLMPVLQLPVWNKQKQTFSLKNQLLKSNYNFLLILLLFPLFAVKGVLFSIKNRDVFFLEYFFFMYLYFNKVILCIRKLK